MKVLKENYAPLFHPYRVFAARTDSRRGCWLVEVRKDIYFDMYYDPTNKLLEGIFGANDNAEANYIWFRNTENSQAKSSLTD